MSQDHYPPLPPTRTGLRGLCPRCGRGRLFEHWLTVAERCEVCGLDYGNLAEAGDAPAVFLNLALGAVVVGLALWVEVTYEPPFWVHILLWFPLIAILGIATLRPLKGLTIAHSYLRGIQEGKS
ncbi:MAG: DUF983 domain-containing protein [Hyphomicrobiales bacterium]